MVILLHLHSLRYVCRLLEQIHSSGHAAKVHDPQRELRVLYSYSRHHQAEPRHPDDRWLIDISMKLDSLEAHPLSVQKREDIFVRELRIHLRPLESNHYLAIGWHSHHQNTNMIETKQPKTIYKDQSVSAQYSLYLALDFQSPHWVAVSYLVGHPVCC